MTAERASYNPVDEAERTLLLVPKDITLSQPRTRGNFSSMRNWFTAKDVQNWLESKPDEDDVYSFIDEIEEKNRRGLLVGLQKRGIVTPLSTVAIEAGVSIYKHQTEAYMKLRSLGLHPIHVHKDDRKSVLNYYFVLKDEQILAGQLIADLS